MRSLVLLLALAACHRTPRADVFVEHRVETAGHAYLAMLPPGADAVLEVDVGRFRRNDVVGKLLALAAPRLRAGEGLLPADPLIDADVVVAAVYDLGAANAATVVIVHGEAVDSAKVVAAAPEAASALDPHTFVFAEPALRDQVEQLAAPAEESRKSMADDQAFAQLRARSMPLRAPGACVRLTARLGKEARITGAGQLNVEELPAAMSLWGDVVDDLAVVAELDGDDGPDARRLKGMLDRGVTLVKALGVDVPLDKLTIDVIENRVRLVWTVGPHALEDWVARLSAPPAAEEKPDHE